MACIVHIETSTDVCSVALSKDGMVAFLQEDISGQHHADELGTYIDEALHFAEEHKYAIDAVAVSSGPGSYTGLRIGVSMAKGICYGNDAKLISVPTLELLCVPILLSHDIEDDALLCPMIDARRMEVYAAVYDRALQEVRGTQADVVDGETYKEYLDKHPVYFFGNGAKKCMDVISHPNAHYIDGILPLAKNMMPLAEKRLNSGKTEDVAYFVPSYFKDYVAKLPKNLLKVEH